MGYWLQYISVSCILISYISSLRAFRLDMPLIFKQFSRFLLFVLLGEAFGVSWPKWIHQLTPFSKANGWFYNPFHVCCYVFYFYFFYRILQSPKLKKLVIAFCIVYLCFVIISFSINGVDGFNPYNNQLASFLMCFLIITYYYQLLTAREIILLKNDMAFWICTGLLVYHLGSVLDLSLINYFSDAAAQKIHMVVMLAAAAMYLTYTIGYLCHKKPSSGKQ